MTRIQFDPTGSMHPEWGLTSDQLRSCRERFTEIREQMCSGHGSAFLALPKRLHQQYETHREASELGRVFQIANGLHDQIDAVVVIGAERHTLGIRALMQACCDPYHNELSRAARGSKPRMYFAGGDLDNDATSTLLNRIACGGYGEAPAEKRWALVIIGDDESAEQSASDRDAMAVASLFLRQLKLAFGNEASDQMSRYVVSIANDHSVLNEFVAGGSMAQSFSFSEGLLPGFDLHSPVGLLPAALLGLDCMKLLGGAHEMTQHFANADFDENIPLQLASQLHTFNQEGKTPLLVETSNRALDLLVVWCQSLIQNELFLLGMTPVSCPDCRTSKFLQDVIVLNVHVDAARCDPIFTGVNSSALEASNTQSEQITLFNRERLKRGVPTSKLTLPQIGMFELGEFIQMWLIVTRVLSELR